MNKKVAKTLGLLSMSEAKTKAGSSDLLYEPLTGDILTGAEINNRTYDDNRYYKLVQPTDENYGEYEQLLRIRDSIRKTESELAAENERYKELTSKLRAKNTASASTRFVVFHNCKKGYNMEPEQITLKNNSVLLDFGRRFDGLWISIIETPGLVHSNNYWKQFDVRTDDYSSERSDRTQKMESTGYRSGERFLESCDEVKVMGGIRQAVPIPTPEQKKKDKEEKKKKIEDDDALIEQGLEPAKNDETRTSVFAYRGMLGILCPPKAEGVLTRPGKGGSFGTVTNANFADISFEALKILRSIRRGSSSLGDIDVFKSAEGPIFSWIGGQNIMLDPKETAASRDYDPSLLTAKKNVDIPEGFKKAVDEKLLFEMGLTND